VQHVVVLPGDVKARGLMHDRRRAMVLALIASRFILRRISIGDFLACS
jgi:hypothetical protein